VRRFNGRTILLWRRSLEATLFFTYRNINARICLGKLNAIVD
jgi:hypothetical protein